MPSTTHLIATAATSFEAGLSYGHALQANGKRELPAEALMHFQTRVLGPYRVGAGVPEVVAILASAAAARRRPGRPRAAARAATLALAANAGAFAVWAAAVQPVNRRLSTWDPTRERQDVPPDWPALRDRWHRLHAVRLGLLSVAVAALVAAGRTPGLA